MLDKSVKYIDILMMRPGSAQLPAWRPAEGFHVVGYEDGSDADWARIETSVLEFNTESEAREYFDATYLPDSEHVRQRCQFIADADGFKVATATFWEQLVDGTPTPWIHWVSACPEYQGRGLGKAMIAAALNKAMAVYGNADCYLHTQTWSHKAIKLYLAAGFKIYTLPGLDDHDNSHWREAVAILDAKGCTVTPAMLYPADSEL